MPEESKVPPPTLKTTPPVAPPVTTVDVETTAAPSPQPEPRESDPQAETSPEEALNGIEADPMKRFLGTLIDAIVIAGVVSVLGRIIDSDLLSNLTLAALWLIRDSLPFLNGQSIGKLAMKTKAVKMDGSSLAGDWQTGALRNILFVIPIVGFLVEGIVFFTRKDSPHAGIRLGDDFAKTKVIAVG